ncbi:MAG: GLPGLI family protein [Bacteroidales bacterium]|nr:GLPGLI family protein [Bacteroidales bacterium]
MLYRIVFCLISLVSSIMVYGQVKDTITSTFLVAYYDYTCRTSDNKGEDFVVSYGLTLQVGQDIACTMGQKRHSGENDKSEQLLYVPTTWQNYPEGKMTSVETIPPYRYLTTEKIVEASWNLQTERDTICGLPCQKATGTYGGRAWTVWFAESLPTRFGPWRLGGLPGLIVRAVSDDGIHRFECNKVEPVKEAITYTIPEGTIKSERAKFVKLRNRIFGNPNYLSNPSYYIKTSEIESMVVMGGHVLLGNIPLEMKPAKFQPLDF